MEFSVLKRDSSRGRPVRAVVLPLVIITVNLNWATKFPGFSVRMGKGTSSSCSRHSLIPIRAVMGSSNELRLKQKEGQRSKTSLKNCLLCLILRLQERSKARLQTVHRRSVSLGLPSPLLTQTSRAKTSWTANSWGSTLCSKVSLLMMTLFPSIKCFLSSWERTPSKGDTSQALLIFWITSVTSLLVWPGFIRRRAAWAALQAARITSAFLPVMGAFLSDWTTMVWPTKAAKPSIWTPSSTLTRSPSLMLVESSWRGALYPQISLTEMVVGKARPLKVGFLLQTLDNSSQIWLSDHRHRSKILEPTVIFLMSLPSTSLAILAETWYFSMTPGVLRVSSYSLSSLSMFNKQYGQIKSKQHFKNQFQWQEIRAIWVLPIGKWFPPSWLCWGGLWNLIQFVNYFNSKPMQGQDIDTEALFSNLSEANPKQLRQVIDVLINKSRLLIHNLEQTWEKLEQTEREKTFWKENYYHLREACQKYADSNGLVPFDYITSLEEELKKEKVSKSCLQEKFKVMHPQSIRHTTRGQRKKPQSQKKQQQQKDQSTIHRDVNKSNSSTHFKQSPNSIKLQSKHKIGPKNIEFFKFRETKMHQ